MSTRLVMAASDVPGIHSFGHDPWWLSAIKVVALFVFLVVSTLLMIWGERRVVARMQQRLGPNRVGPFGVLQGLADGIKLALKEDIVPRLTDKPIFWIAPVIATIPAFMAFAVIPFGPIVSIFGHRTPLQLTDLPVAVLYILAMSAIGVYGIVLAGWSSGSPYPLLGGLRSAAQVISYEVAMGLALAAVFLYSGSLSTSEIVGAQDNIWFGLTLLPSFVIYVISMIGETNRAPFDLPESESELVGGFHTEYSSLKFALFFLAEYVNMGTVSALATTLFLGGWRAPWPISIWDGANHGWWPVLWFLGKFYLFMFFYIWLRGTLPRLRYDQFMQLGWKILIPASLVWIMVVAAFRQATLNGFSRGQLLTYVGIPIAVLLLLIALWPAKKDVDDAEAAAVGPGEAPPSSYPVPVLSGRPGARDLQTAPDVTPTAEAPRG